MQNPRNLNNDELARTGIVLWCNREIFHTKWKTGNPNQNFICPILVVVK